MKYSLTISGVIVSVAGTLLLQFGFTEQCSNEILKLTPTLIGGIMSWIGRYRHGDINIGGIKK
jgi:hypothetical protein